MAAVVYIFISHVIKVNILSDTKVIIGAIYDGNSSFKLSLGRLSAKKGNFAPHCHSHIPNAVVAVPSKPRTSDFRLHTCKLKFSTINTVITLLIFCGCDLWFLLLLFVVWYKSESVVCD